MSQSPDIENKLRRGISNFRISVQSLIKENCHKPRTSNDIDMKLGLTKLGKRNKATSKKFVGDVMSTNFDVTVNLWLIWSGPEAFYFTKTETSKIKRALLLKGIFSKTTKVCVLTYQV